MHFVDHRWQALCVTKEVVDRRGIVRETYWRDVVAYRDDCAYVLSEDGRLVPAPVWLERMKPYVEVRIVEANTGGIPSENYKREVTSAGEGTLDDL